MRIRLGHQGRRRHATWSQSSASPLLDAGKLVCEVLVELGRFQLQSIVGDGGSSSSNGSSEEESEDDGLAIQKAERTIKCSEVPRRLLQCSNVQTR